MSSTRRLGTLVGGLGTVLGLVACTSRTLPLPPPDVDPIPPPNAQGLVMVTGTAQANAAVGVLNEMTGVGTIVTADDGACAETCPFEAAVAAEPGDALRIWQFFETNRSVEREVP